jgi:hypothetical protein
MTIDMNELQRRDPNQYHQRLALNAGGRIQQLKRGLGNVRDSGDRERLNRELTQARADLSYHQRQLAELETGGKS